MGFFVCKSRFILPAAYMEVAMLSPLQAASPYRATRASKLAEENKNLVYWALRSLKIKHWHQDYEDAVQEARLALYHCGMLWDAHRGVKFSSYAGTALLRQLSKFLTRRRKHLLRNLVNEDEIPGGYDEYDDAEELDQRRLSAVMESMHCLPERTRKLVEGHYLDKRTLRDLGREWCITQERVRQVIVAGVIQLKRMNGHT